MTCPTERPCPNVECPEHMHRLVSRELRRAPLGEWPFTCERDIPPGPHTLEAVGRVLGFTRERCRQIEARAIERLTARIRIERLDMAPDR